MYMYKLVINNFFKMQEFVILHRDDKLSEHLVVYN